MSVFIACSKSKKSVPCLSSEMYQGALFKKSLIYAKQLDDSIYILSAKYGVLDLNQFIEPYDLTLSKMKKTEREIWLEKIKKQIKKKKIKPPFVFLTGFLYCNGLEGEKPMHGLSMGYRLQWLNKRIKSKGFNIL